MGVKYILIHRLVLYVFIFLFFGFQAVVAQSARGSAFMNLSVDFIDLQKKSQDVSYIVDAFASSTLEEIEAEMNTDEEKLAFWVNVYNGFIQYVLLQQPELYEDRGKFFNTERIKIAGETLSLANIEHGIIRRSSVSWSLGLFSNPFTAKYERALRVEKRDWRIHFALNCGAKSCPPVATYHADWISDELDYMSEKYLKEHTEYLQEEKLAKTTTLFSWFRGDFGGKRGVKCILADYKVTPEKPTNLEFNTYDWTLDLGNYREIPR